MCIFRPVLGGGAEKSEAQRRAVREAIDWGGGEAAGRDHGGRRGRGACERAHQAQEGAPRRAAGGGEVGDHRVRKCVGIGLRRYVSHWSGVATRTTSAPRHDHWLTRTLRLQPLLLLLLRLLLLCMNAPQSAHTPAEIDGISRDVGQKLATLQVRIDFFVLVQLLLLAFPVRTLI